MSRNQVEIGSRTNLGQAKDEVENEKFESVETTLGQASNQVENRSVQSRTVRANQVDIELKSRWRLSSRDGVWFCTVKESRERSRDQSRIPKYSRSLGILST